MNLVEFVILMVFAIFLRCVFRTRHTLVNRFLFKTRRLEALTWDAWVHTVTLVIRGK